MDARTELSERLLDVLKEMRTAASQGVLPVKLHAWANRIESEAALALQSSVGGDVVGYWVPNARACSDGSWEDGPGNLVLAQDATDKEREYGAPLYLASPATPSDGWRTIDSAPRDGTEILIYFARDGVGVRQVAYTEAANNDYESWCVDDLKFGPYPLRRWCDGDAIAWMPLPAAPSATNDVAGGG